MEAMICASLRLSGSSVMLLYHLSVRRLWWVQRLEAEQADWLRGVAVFQGTKMLRSSYGMLCKLPVDSSILCLGLLFFTGGCRDNLYLDLTSDCSGCPIA